MGRKGTQNLAAEYSLRVSEYNSDEPEWGFSSTYSPW
jgi:hypothetical protein